MQGGVSRCRWKTGYCLVALSVRQKVRNQVLVKNCTGGTRRRLVDGDQAAVRTYQLGRQCPKKEAGHGREMRAVSTEDQDARDARAVEGGWGDTEKPAAERKILYWRAPMDPNFTSDQPGKAPTGMDLIPVYAQEAVAPGAVRVDPSFTQNFAVRTAVAEKGSISLDIRTVGILSHNEKAIVSVNTRFEGWIEKAFYNNIGEAVQRGDRLFQIYSPQLVTTQ